MAQRVIKTESVVVKQSKGAHVSESDLREHYDRCEKNPGHKDFVPITDFDTKHLHKEYNDRDIVAFIKATADLTVRVDVKVTSAERPEFWPYTRVPYDSYEWRGSNVVRLGTGVVLGVNKWTQEDNQGTCRCETCKHSDTPSKVWGQVWLGTTASLVFGDTEAQHTTCRFFYDRQDSPLVTLENWTVVNTGIGIDRCTLKHATCDVDLLDKLNNLNNHRDGIWDKLYDKYNSYRDADTLIFIVSHPHGCPKQVSVGHWLNKYVEEDGWVRYTYTTCTCPGSSGACVALLAYNYVGRCRHQFHSGVNSEGINISSARKEIGANSGAINVSGAPKESGANSDEINISSAHKESGANSEEINISSARKEIGANSGAINVSGAPKESGANSEEINISSAPKESGVNSEEINISSAHKESGANSEEINISSARKEIGANSEGIDVSSARKESGVNSGEINISSAPKESGVNSGEINISSAPKEIGANSGEINISSAPKESGANSGEINISSAPKESGANSEEINISSAPKESGANSGEINISSAPKEIGANSGEINISSAPKESGANSGEINISSAPKESGANSGEINISSAPKESGANSGEINISSARKEIGVNSEGINVSSLRKEIL